MPCMDGLVSQSNIEAALLELGRALDNGDARVVVGDNGAVAFAGEWDRRGMSDVCAYRALLVANSWELRQAVARAEALAGRSIDRQMIETGVHSHDGGVTWAPGH